MGDRYRPTRRVDGDPPAGPDVMAAIRDEMIRRGWSQRRLEREAGLPATTLCRWLSGEREPGVRQVAPVLGALGLVVRRSGRPR